MHSKMQIQYPCPSRNYQRCRTPCSYGRRYTCGQHVVPYYQRPVYARYASTILSAW